MAEKLFYFFPSNFPFSYSRIIYKLKRTFRNQALKNDLQFLETGTDFFLGD